jgi:predicted nucleotidyltransferase
MAQSSPRPSGPAGNISIGSEVEDQLRRVLEQVANVQLAVLFGSAARGAAGSKSDLDVGISLRGRDGADELPLALRVALERATGRAVDLISLDESPPLLRFEIARGGRVLLKRHPHDWADFRARAMIDWWDWAPTARMVHRTVARRLVQEAGHGSA